MSVAVAVFPGSNCDQDIVSAAAMLAPDKKISRCYFHETQLPPDTSVLFLPGGFAYGDYLRVGALAKTAPIMSAIREFAEAGGRVIGICNGFQILCDAGLLPGALQPHASNLFSSRPVSVKLSHTENTCLSELDEGQALRWPISNHSGRYYVSEADYGELEKEGAFFLRYASPSSANNISDDTDLNTMSWDIPVTDDFSPHEKSLLQIAGVRNKRGNIFGCMPHPERAIDPVCGGACGDDGSAFMRALFSNNGPTA